MVFKQFFNRYWPILTYILIIAVLFFANYLTGTYLTGWDNLHPEFNFWVNIKRSLFAVWQEYQGLGLLGGMGHASDLVRQVILLFFSFVLPQELLRYAWTFLMLFSGTTGAYFLIRRLWLTAPEQKPFAFLGGLFYLLNLATIQQFYAPFEAFIAHFGFLPWLLAASLLYVKNATGKSLAMLFVVLFIATPAAYIPTLFVVYLMALGVFLLVQYALTPSKEFVKRVIKLFSIIFVVNAFWLLPFLFFTLTQSSVTLNAKINQMATETVYQQNKEFGTLDNVMLLKGFWFNNVDPNTQQVFDYMLKPWKDHSGNFLIAGIGYFFFLVICFGIITALRQKKQSAQAFFGVFILCILMLTIATPPFSWINSVFRSHLPILNEAFRFPFTKFSNLTSLIYTLFFAYGVFGLTHLLTQKKQLLQYHIKERLPLITCAFFSLLLVIFTLPAFTGSLFYSKEKLSIPKEYFDLFSFFQKQDPNTRIADFPQYTFWGWNFYRWGYGGSGFLWYGIKQPIIDRAFDVWSAKDENYYWEISYAMYSKNLQAFENVLNKYQISWLIVDRNVINPGSPKTLFTNELQSLVTHIPSVKKTATFGNLVVYKVSLKNPTHAFVEGAPQLPTVNNYVWNNWDEAYHTVGNYESTAGSAAYTYPFRSFLSSRSQSDNAFSASENETSITAKTTLPAANATTTISIPSFQTKEHIIPVVFEETEDKLTNKLTISYTVTTPDVMLNGKKISGDHLTKPLFTIEKNVFSQASHSGQITLNINGAVSYPLADKEGIIGTSFLTLTQNNIIVLADTLGDNQVSATIPAASFSSTSLFVDKAITIPPHRAPESLTITYTKVTDNYVSFSPSLTTATPVTNCDRFRTGDITESKVSKTGITLSAINATACTSFYTPHLPHDIGYILFLTAQNVSGRGMHFWIENIDQESSPVDTYLPAKSSSSHNTFVIPSMESFGSGYSFHTDSVSIGQDNVTNLLQSLHVYYFPYNFLSGLVITNPSLLPRQSDSPDITTVSHPDESRYIVTLTPSHTSSTLILSQAYDTGWKAYQLHSNTPSLIAQWFPFFSGKALPTHVRINNWENGWQLPSSQPDTETIVMVYVPQYLEYIGFLLLISFLTGSILYQLKLKLDRKT